MRKKLDSKDMVYDSIYMRFKSQAKSIWHQESQQNIPEDAVATRACTYAEINGRVGLDLSILLYVT